MEGPGVRRSGTGAGRAMWASECNDSNSSGCKESDVDTATSGHAVLCSNAAGPEWAKSRAGKKTSNQPQPNTGSADPGYAKLRGKEGGSG